MAAAKTIAMEISRDQKLPYVNGYDHPHIMSGQGTFLALKIVFYAICYGYLNIFLPKKLIPLGTIGLEIVEQCEGADAIVVPVGGGGLIAGIATAVKTLSPNTKIIASDLRSLADCLAYKFIPQGVESDKCPSFSKALENGGPIYTPNLATLADGLAVPKVNFFL